MLSIDDLHTFSRYFFLAEFSLCDLMAGLLLPSSHEWDFWKELYEFFNSDLGNIHDDEPLCCFIMSQESFQCEFWGILCSLSGYNNKMDLSPAVSYKSMQPFSPSGRLNEWDAVRQESESTAHEKQWWHSTSKVLLLTAQTNLQIALIWKHKAVSHPLWQAG